MLITLRWLSIALVVIVLIVAVSEKKLPSKEALLLAAIWLLLLQ